MTRIKRHYVAICCNGVAINKKDQPSLGFPFLFFDVWIWDPFGCFHTQVHTAFFLQHQRAHVRWSHWFNMVQLPQLLKNVSVILWWTRDIQKQLMCAWIHALTIAGEAHVDGKTKIPMFIRNKDECPTGLLLLSLAHWRFDRGKKRANTLPSGMMAMWFHGPARKTRLKTVIGDVLRAFHKWVGRLWHLQLFLVIGRRFWNVLKFLKPWSDSNSSWGHVWKIESDQTTVIPNWEIGWICFSPLFSVEGKRRWEALSSETLGPRLGTKVRSLGDEMWIRRDGSPAPLLLAGLYDTWQVGGGCPVIHRCVVFQRFPPIFS